MTRTAKSDLVGDGDDLAFARAALAAVAASFDTTPHQVVIDCDPNLRLPRHLMKHFQIAAREALDNALKHAFPNHIQGRVWVRLNYDCGRLRLTVRDNGVGMPDFADYDAGGRARIFEAARAVNAYVRMGAAPFSGALVSVTCAE